MLRVLFFIYRTCVSPFEYCLKHLMLAVSEKRKYESFTLHSFDYERAPLFFTEVIKALSLLANYAPQRYQRVRKYLKKIAFLKLGIGYYDPSFSAYIVDSFPDNDPLYLASAILHEATHAYLKAKGFSYSPITAERHERLCVKEQIRLIKRVVDRQRGWSEEEKKRYLSEWTKSFDEAINLRPWESHKILANQFKRLQELVKGKL